MTLEPVSYNFGPGVSDQFKKKFLAAHAGDQPPMNTNDPQFQKSVEDMKDLMSKDVTQLAAQEAPPKNLVEVRGRKIIIPEGAAQANRIFAACLLALGHPEVDRILRDLKVSVTVLRDDGDVERVPLVPLSPESPKPPTVQEGPEDADRRPIRSILLGGEEEPFPAPVVAVKLTPQGAPQAIGVPVERDGPGSVRVRLLDGKEVSVEEGLVEWLRTPEEMYHALAFIVPAKSEHIR